MKKVFLVFTLLLCVLTSCNQTAPIELNVMSFNIRLDHPADNMNNWQYRKDIAAQVIKDQNIAIVGAQEVLVNQLNDLKMALPEYKAVGVGRADGIDGGEYSPILYQSARFTEVISGNFWLSETPEVAGSKGWDGACERIATWAVLEEINSKKQLFVMNTHLDHIGQVARREGVALLLKRAAELGKGLPLILTGDFNATPESEVIRRVTDTSNPDHLMHSKEVAETKTGPEWTFHDFGRYPLEKREFIDYIFVSKDIKVLHHAVLPEMLDNRYLSDHSLVTVRLVIE